METATDPTTNSENLSQDTLESFDKSLGPALVSSTSLDVSLEHETPPFPPTQSGVQTATQSVQSFTKDVMQYFEQDSLEATEPPREDGDKDGMREEAEEEKQLEQDPRHDDEKQQSEQEMVDSAETHNKPAPEPGEEDSSEPREKMSTEPEEESIVVDSRAPMAELQEKSAEPQVELNGSTCDENKENVFDPKLENEPTSEGQVTFDVEEETRQPRLGDDSNLIELQDIANEILHHTFESATNTSRFPQQTEEKRQTESDKMEFTKNYSDDLLMGSGEQRESSGSNIDPAGHDLADFELPPYNGSSSGSEQAVAKNSPIKQRKSSSSTATQSSSPSHASNSLVPTDLSAVKNIIISSYSKVSHIFHWKNPIESGIVFVIGMTLITALTFFSIISVVAYSALGIVLASGLVRFYKTSMKALNRSTETPVDHIWERVLNLNVSLSPDKLHEIIDTSHANLNASLVYFKQVLLVEDKVATFKFFLFVYSLTYIGAWFNGLTLITIIYVSLFSIPIFYEINKTKIDEYLNLATDQISSTISTVTNKVTTLAFGSQSVAGTKKQN